MPVAVLEVYSDWCGPSKAINATLKRLYFEHGDRGLKFYTVPSGLLDVTKLHEGKCEPAFMFFRNGQELKGVKIEGINAPKLTTSIIEKLGEITAAA
jgi:thiol-disulfide isomerase/thioredoxin